jgi:hypothetical protein
MDKDREEHGPGQLSPEVQEAIWAGARVREVYGGLIWDPRALKKFEEKLDMSEWTGFIETACGQRFALDGWYLQQHQDSYREASEDGYWHYTPVGQPWVEGEIHTTAELNPGAQVHLLIKRDGFEGIRYGPITVLATSAKGYEVKGSAHWVREEGIDAEDPQPLIVDRRTGD